MENQKATVIEPDFKLYSEVQIIKAVLQIAHEENYPVALWRMPHQKEVNLLISLSEAKTVKRYELQELKNGFAFAPFNFNEEPGYFLQADLMFSFDFDETIFKTASISEEEISSFKVKIFERLEKSSDEPEFNTQEFKTELKTDNYKQLVSKCVEAINNDHFEKIVPARAKEIRLPEDFQVINLFNQLSSAYQNAFISFVSIPKVGSWFGATPEVLIERHGQYFRTTALAATQSFQENQSLGDTAWTQKEIEEQAMVSRYIINCFKKIRLRDFKEKGPETVKAGNLLHLKTTFEVNLIETNFPELPTVMLELLHPTSAVAGMPKESALSFLKKEEVLDRSFYSGFLGPVNIEDKTNLFVNLRCMELSKDSARLYAGAGVTAHSDPEKEFAETEMKFNTLLNILNQAH